MQCKRSLYHSVSAFVKYHFICFLEVLAFSWDVLIRDEHGIVDWTTEAWTK